MSPEAFSAVLGGLTDGVVGAVLGFIFAYLLFRLTQKRKLVEYSVSSISLLRLKPGADSVLTVSVSKEVITGDPADHNEMLPLNTVYGFQIFLSVGNEDIEKIDDIEISLDPEAKIVKCETEPQSTSGYRIEVQQDPKHPNMLHLSVPYLNANTNMVARLITTENANSDCAIKVYGVGIKTRSARSRRSTMMLGLAIGVLFYIVSFVLLVLEDNIKHIPFFINDPLSWAMLIFLLLAVVSFACTVTLTTLQEKRQKFSQDWDWEVPPAEKKQNFLQKWFS